MTEIEQLLSDSLTALLLQFEQQTTTVRDLADRIERLEILINPAPGPRAAGHQDRRRTSYGHR